MDNTVTSNVYKPKDPERKGYKFNGWYKEKECIGPFDFDEEFVDYTEDRPEPGRYVKEYTKVDIYAGWLQI